ncbi:MAG: T9SS type A sorting domain-containing protein [Saprospiraceae bacterium]|nr:T9SS type A sorting domain-containing protein [Saprospiraceae bacterium]
MLWQFGELGYEFSINYCPNGTISENCRVDVKPIRWEYFQAEDRKRLYELTSKVIAFKTKYEVTETRDYRGDLFSSIRKTFQLDHPEFLTTVLGNFDLVPQPFFPNFQQTGWWYEYFTGDSLLVTNVNQTINLQPGEYRLYTSKNLNQTDFISSTFDLHADYQLQLFPNPTREEINLVYTLQQPDSVDIAVFDLNGKLLQQLDIGQMPSGRFQAHLPLHLPSGSYWLKLRTERGQQFLKFVVQ